MEKNCKRYTGSIIVSARGMHRAGMLGRAAMALIFFLLIPVAAFSAAADSAPPPGLGPFEYLAGEVAEHPDDVQLGNELRRWCRDAKTPDRCIDFFNELVASHPEVDGLRYNAALAYVDKIPGRSLISQARLSTRSIEHISTILDRLPEDWLARYIRGVNNIYWPSWYRRIDRAISDLEHCLALTDALPPEQQRPYYVYAYVALGDALTKADRRSEAIAVWRRGFQIYPSPQLQRRLDASENEIEKMVEQIRSRDVPVDTDLLFLVDDASAEKNETAKK